VNVWQELDYVTEKYAQALESGTVPIVIGATNIEDYEVAPNSMLVLRDVEDVPAVVERVKYLLGNRTAYEEMLAWKRTGPQDKFLALVDLGVVHSSCRLCIHLATEIRAAEDAASAPLPCRCRKPLTGTTVHHVRVRERGRFDFRDVFLESGNVTMAALHHAILREFKQAGHRPIWVSHRPDFRSEMPWWEPAAEDVPVDLRIYRVYAVGATQRAALYGNASLDTDAKVVSAIRARACPQLEVVFV
jgi:glycoprotein 3-alpha-L-fucosyltransferase